MRILFSTISSSSYMAPPSLSDEQVNCGPDWHDQEIAGQVLSLSTPTGDYDLAAVAARLPADQQPDVVVCLVDAGWRALPRNLRAFRCPKVLLVADTHHMNAPLSGMVRYALSEPFDRVVLLYDRHHWEFFQAAGVRGLCWFPGLTFPHGDRSVFAARNERVRKPHLGFVGQVGINHPRRIQMLSHLNAEQVPLEVQALSQRDALGFYGESLVGFNASLNGDLNVRVFEILASGAMLLTDQLAPASGLAQILTPGRELVTYGSPSEMIERARHALAHPEETRLIGEAGARWFDCSFNQQVRRATFERLVFDGQVRPEFELPKAQSFSLGTRAGLDPHLVAGFEYVQELHRNLDRVSVALDETVPEAFAQMCATLPRLDVSRGLPTAGKRVQFLAVGRKHFSSPVLLTAAHVWPWDPTEKDRVPLIQRCASMGFTLADNHSLIFARQQVNTQNSAGAGARWSLEKGAYEAALSGAKTELAKNPKSVDALIVMAELAQATGNAAAIQPALAKLRVIAPHHPRVREVLATSTNSVRGRRTRRILEVARAFFEQRNWDMATKMANEALGSDGYSAEAHHVLARILAQRGEVEKALTYHAIATRVSCGTAEHWFETGRTLRKHRRPEAALAPLLLASVLEPDQFEYQFAVGETALAAGHARIAIGALENASRLRPGFTAAIHLLENAHRLEREFDYARPRKLLLSHLEITRLQGTGVLLQRFFPEPHDFITLRSHTLYQGQVQFGGIHFAVDLPGAPVQTRRMVLQRLLEPYCISQILVVPFFSEDFEDAIAAREITCAPLCTYVMDDQTLHTQAVPRTVAQRLFATSDLRLAISPEMVEEYSKTFGCSFGLLPPIVTTNADRVPNRYRGGGAGDRCAMVGNVWTAKQFEQLRCFTRAAGLKIDWYGNANVAWLPQDATALESDGIYRQGFLPEDQLANRLGEYPFVVIPSGVLDGTEDNEWLTRLSLPSRMVFILTKTFTPMLILGSEKTAAARFVNRFGLGTSSNYDAAEAREKIRTIMAADARRTMVANAEKVAPCFLFPNSGEWIWRSLAARQPQSTPFDALYPEIKAICQHTGSLPPLAGTMEVASAKGQMPERNGDLRPDPRMQEYLDGIVLKMADTGLVESYFQPNEVRMRQDIRAAVRFLHRVLQRFATQAERMAAIERLAAIVQNQRAVLVCWAELLEQSGDRTAAAAKARQALSLHYDDAYTQALFLRCVGDRNYHAAAQDRYCPHPFENFEIYEDGSVFPCNCTQVPFPIGNAFTQDALTIWRSPAARAIRESILDGSFRFCSPMTCWRRFDLPKRSDNPAEFERLKRIGVDGTTLPKNLNLSYDRSCNLSCPSCRSTRHMASHDQRQVFERVREKVVLPLLANKEAKGVYITGSGDAFGSPHFRGLLKELCDPKYEHIKITLGTNGQLLTPRLWEELKPLHKRFGDISISIDGATPESYERHRRGSTWERLQNCMGILANARRNSVIARLMVNMVVQTDNFREMRPLIAMCKAWNVDGLRFYRIRQWGTVTSEAYMASDIANPMHPQHSELLAELTHPDFADPVVDRYDMYDLIKSVHTHARQVAAVVRAEELWARVQAMAETCAQWEATAFEHRDDFGGVPELVGRVDEFLSEFTTPQRRRFAVELLSAVCGSNPAIECAIADVLFRDGDQTAAASRVSKVRTLSRSTWVPGLAEHLEGLARQVGIASQEGIHASVPGFVTRKTSVTPLPPVSRESIDGVAGRLARRVAGKTVGLLLHGSSISKFGTRAGDPAVKDVVWIGVNHFSLLEDRFLKPAQQEFSVVFCCADGEVERRLPALQAFLRRGPAKLLITRPDHYARFGEQLGGADDSVALQQLPPLWPYPNSLAMLLRLLVQAKPRRIILFGCDGYLGDDDLSLPTYIGADEFAREKRYSGVLLDTLLFNAHMPRVLGRWRDELGSSFPEIVNCSPGTTIRAFPTLDYGQAITALGGGALTLGAATVPHEVAIPPSRQAHDPAPALAACLNAGRKGDLTAARQHAMEAMRLAPERLNPFARRILQTDPRAVAAAYNLLLLTQDNAPELESLRSDLARELRDCWEAVGSNCQRWDDWEEPDRGIAQTISAPCLETDVV